MTFMDRIAAGWLRPRGYVVWLPGVEPPVPLKRAIEVVCAARYSVVRPLQVPPIDSVWVPQPNPDRKGKRALPLHATLSRTVIAADESRVTYERGGERHEVTLRGWYSWRHDAQAKVQEPMP